MEVGLSVACGFLVLGEFVFCVFSDEMFEFCWFELVGVTGCVVGVEELKGIGVVVFAG